MTAALFVNPMVLPFNSLLWLLLPLCVSVAVVYKTIRTEYLRRLPQEILVLLVYMLVGLLVLAGAMWLLADPGILALTGR